MVSLICPYASAQERDYERYLVIAVRKWRKSAFDLIRENLDTYKDGWIDNLLNSIATTWAALAPDLERDVVNIMTRVNVAQRKWWVQTVSKVSGAHVDAVDPFLTEPWLNEEINTRVQENIALIKDIEAQASKKLLYIIRNGTRSGTSRKEMTLQIQAVMDSTESRARIIARDQVQKHNSALNQIRQQEAGVEEYRWSTVGDTRVRPAHREREGKIFRWDNPPSGGHPGEAVLCRCVAIAVLKDDIYQFPVKERFRNAA